MTNDAPRNVELRRGLERSDDEGGASRARKRSVRKSLSTTPLISAWPDPANPLLNPATSTRHAAEDAADKRQRDST